MPDFLYDLPKNFYEQAVVTDGKFDPAKAEACGYGPGQFAAIRDFLGLDNDTAPLRVETDFGTETDQPLLPGETVSIQE